MLVVLPIHINSLSSQLNTSSPKNIEIYLIKIRLYLTNLAMLILQIGTEFEKKTTNVKKTNKVGIRTWYETARSPL